MKPKIALCLSLVQISMPDYWFKGKFIVLRFFTRTRLSKPGPGPGGAETKSRRKTYILSLSDRHHHRIYLWP